MSGTRRDPPGIGFLQAAARRLFGTDIGRANDDPRVSHADVLRAYDLAITLAAAEASA